jgi:hypothetical protein
MSPAPRPYIQPPEIRGSNGGELHMSSGPVGTTSIWPLRISDFPFGSRGRWAPTTFQASSYDTATGENPCRFLMSSTSIFQRSTVSPRSRMARAIRSCAVASCPRSDGTRVSSAVNATSSSKPSSTALRMRLVRSTSGMRPHSA